MIEKTPYSICELLSILKNDLHDLGIQAVYGELSSLTISSLGHWYLELKDENTSDILSCVLFSPSAKLSIPQKGDMLLLVGALDIYEKRGALQFQISRIGFLGEGRLEKKLEKLKNKLQDEGLFDLKRKKSLPFIAERIGVVTSEKAAALHDIQSVIQRRSPISQLILFPTPVQGKGAAFGIQTAIQLAQSSKANLDVLILARGGGSREDLSAFDDEGVVRTLANCKIPTITGIGHESDTTLSDFVSDFRAATPSAAAESATLEHHELKALLETLSKTLNFNTQKHLLKKKESLQALLFRNKPLTLPLTILQEKLQTYRVRLYQELKTSFHQKKDSLHTLNLRLEGIDALRRLKEGWALLYEKEGGNRIQNKEALKAHLKQHHSIWVHFQDGGLKVKLETQNSHSPKNP